MKLVEVNFTRYRQGLQSEVAGIWNSLPESVLKTKSSCGLKQRLDNFREDTSSEGYQIYRATSGSESLWAENSWRLEEHWGKYHMLALLWLFSRHPIRAAAGDGIRGYMKPSSDPAQPSLCSDRLFAIRLCLPWESKGALACKIPR